MDYSLIISERVDEQLDNIIRYVAGIFHMREDYIRKS